MIQVTNHLKEFENYNFILPEFKKETKLHMIRIRFGTSTFDRVTRLLKANFVDKLSHFGGTAGLFTGCSFISTFELIPLAVALLIMLGQFLTNRNKESKTDRVQEIKTKENEKTNEDIDHKLNAIIQKIASIEMNINQTLKTLEKEVKEKVDIHVHVMEQRIEKKMANNQLALNQKNMGQIHKPSMI